MTIGVGTINGILFYANIVSINADTYFPFSTPNLATVFISWLNLDIGFDICFFEGMDVYHKASIQLAFPIYIIFLVIIVIIISEYSTKFAKLIGKGNPVAALATMILLSYTKLFNVVLGTISFWFIQSPNGSRAVRKNIELAVLDGEYIFLIVFAPIIFLLGISYTALIFSWQWLLRCQGKPLFKWVRYQKLHHFIEPYHGPYTSEYRFWTGLLLLVRVLLLLVSAVAKKPEDFFLSVIFIISCIILAKGVTAKRIYKNWLVDVMETSIYFNLVVFAAFTVCNLDTKGNQAAIAYTSVMVPLILFLVVIAFHALRYTRLYKCPLVQKMFKQISSKLNKKEPNQEVPVDTPEELDGYQLERVQEPATVTHSVVEIPHPFLENPEERTENDSVEDTLQIPA